MPSSRLAPLQEFIYEQTKDLIIEHDGDLPVEERLRLPFQGAPTSEDFSKVMRALDNSPEVLAVVQSPEVCAAFQRIFDTQNVKQFPISRLRAQFPNVGRSTYQWHQDEGTWYAIPVKDLAYKLPATLWLSINGADSSNSIEIILDSHRSKLERHYKVEGQGFFNADVPESMANNDHRIITTLPGEGVAFHPLTFHRSVVGTVIRPRYSIDIRFYSDESAGQRYPVSWRFRLERLFTR